MHTSTLHVRYTHKRFSSAAVFSLSLRELCSDEVRGVSVEPQEMDLMGVRTISPRPTLLAVSRGGWEEDGGKGGKEEGKEGGEGERRGRREEERKTERGEQPATSYEIPQGNWKNKDYKPGDTMARTLCTALRTRLSIAKIQCGGVPWRLLAAVTCRTRSNKTM